jgi:hypothetical protein
LTQLAAIRLFMSATAREIDSAIESDFRIGKRFARATRLYLAVENLDGSSADSGDRQSAKSKDSLSVLDAAIGELEVFTF